MLCTRYVQVFGHSKKIGAKTVICTSFLGTVRKFEPKWCSVQNIYIFGRSKKVTADGLEPLEPEENKNNVCTRVHTLLLFSV